MKISPPRILSPTDGPSGPSHATTAPLEMATDSRHYSGMRPTAETSRRTVGARIGGRSERVVRDVLRAAIVTLGRSGYGALRVEDVAESAGVNKTTVYRR